MTQMTHTTRSTYRTAPRRKAMTFFELLLSLLVIAAMLGTACRVSGMLREDDAEMNTRHVLRALHDALRTYHQAHGEWPPESTPDAISAMLASKATASSIRQLEPTHDSSGRLVIRDGFDRPVRYLMPRAGSSAEADFVSAGRDGRFGNLVDQAVELDSDLADNLYGVDQNTYSAEPRPSSDIDNDAPADGVSPPDTAPVDDAPTPVTPEQSPSP